jgi:hypothetical protein
VVSQEAPRGFARGAAWQVHNHVSELGHCLLLCAC